MRGRYLRVTYRGGKVVAAYLCLPRQTGVKSARTKPMAPGIVVDFEVGGAPIGVEITAPLKVTADQVNEVLKRLGVAPVLPEEWAPLQAA